MIPLDESTTYRDGVGILRCKTCLHALRTPSQEPLVVVREADLEAVLGVLADQAPELASRIAQALGRSAGAAARPLSEQEE